MNYNNIFNRFASQPASREVDFSNLPNMDRKIEVLENAGYKINPGTVYEVAITLKRQDNEPAFKFASRVYEYTKNESAGNEVITKNLRTWTGTAKKAWSDLGKAEKLDVLSREAGDLIKSGKFIEEVFGGSNFVAFCQWVREMSADDFETLCNTK